MPKAKPRQKSSFARGVLVALVACCVVPGVSVERVRGQSWCSDDGEIRKRLASGDAVEIESVNQCGPEAVPSLEKALRDKRPEVKKEALVVLGGLEADASEALPAIVDILTGTPGPTLRQASARAVEGIAEGALERAYELEKSDRKEIAELKEVSEPLGEAIADLEKDSSEVMPETARDIRLAGRGIQERLSALESGIAYRIGEWVEKNPWVWFPVGYVLLYLVCFALRPRWLLIWDERVAKIIEGLPVPKGFKLIPSTVVSILSFLRYHPHVLDAWVASHLGTARERFARKTTVAQRKTYVSIVPVKMDGGEGTEGKGRELGPQDLRSHFQQKRNRLSIWGEGGAGKTSLACQIGKWGMSEKKGECLCDFPMLPVLIEQELTAEGKEPFLEAVRGQLTDLTEDKQPLSEKLLERLLRERRVLVVVDHFSEMSEETRKLIRPESAGFPANALVVTSRSDEELGGVTKTCLCPMRIDGDKIARFVDAYLVAREKRHILEDDDDYFDTCKRMSRMVDTRPVTVLLAKLYADELIAAREPDGAGEGRLPENVPDLMRRYVKNLNRTYTKTEEWKTRDVLRDAKVVALCCLQPGYVPGQAKKRTDAIEALKSVSEAKDAESRLEHLEERLRLVQRSDSGERIKFVLDPLSEYLGALLVVEQCGNSAEKWEGFLSELESPVTDLEKAQGFVLALRDCCEVEQDTKVPEGIADKLAEMGGLSRESIERIQRQRKIAKSIRALQDPTDRPPLELALQRISEWGKEASKAVPTLKNLTENKKLRNDVQLQVEIVKALRAIGTEEAILPLKEMSRDSELKSESGLQVEIVEALGAIGTEAAVSALNNVLMDDSHELKIRTTTWSVLRRLGEAVPVLIVTVREGEVETRVSESIATEIKRLPEGIELEMVSIPAGKYWMGSDEGEGDESERPRHEVEIASFQLGRYPVTQAQWRVVATHLARVNVELNPYPFDFGGDTHPVERVSWYEAVEFCARLSAYTGRPYRLPSEAEWEYACRAGTTTRYAFGDEISPEVANYGFSNRGTTPVDQFWIANEFGLSDMHGNVFEWCQDHWHGSYEENDISLDGSPWMSPDEGARRVIRGGSRINDPRSCRSAFRYSSDPGVRSSYIGFRVACAAPRT